MALALGEQRRNNNNATRKCHQKAPNQPNDTSALIWRHYSFIVTYNSRKAWRAFRRTAHRRCQGLVRCGLTTYTKDFLIRES